MSEHYCEKCGAYECEAELSQCPCGAWLCVDCVMDGSHAQHIVARLRSDLAAARRTIAKLTEERDEARTLAVKARDLFASCYVCGAELFVGAPHCEDWCGLDGDPCRDLHEEWACEVRVLDANLDAMRAATRARTEASMAELPDDVAELLRLARSCNRLMVDGPMLERDAEEAVRLGLLMHHSIARDPWGGRQVYALTWAGVAARRRLLDGRRDG